MVNHNILLCKICGIGVTGSFHQLLTSYLTDRTQQVKVTNSLSCPRKIHSGVPQGSILGPTLFQIFINDLLDLELSLKVHAYADDTIFFMAGKALKTVQAKAQIDLDRINNWCMSKTT